ncbi:MAG: peptidase C45 [Planctomyces sp.]|nr:peptidase C45 [Planctomyces sp.]
MSFRLFACTTSRDSYSTFFRNISGRFSRIGLLLGLLLMSSALLDSSASACTTAVISGKATRDGRPLLWKNRDAPNVRNEVVFLEDGKYKVLAVVNAGARQSIWMGMNSAGLCIENSVTNDLAFPKESKGLGNGSFMLKVLRECATVRDVEQLLVETDKMGRSTAANFGVIDAAGGAVLFESARGSFRKFDANDPLVAPLGYVARSNFSITGKKLADHPAADELGSIYSANRYLRANALLAERIKSGTAKKADGLDVRYLLRHVARDLAEADGAPCTGSVNGTVGDLPPFIETKNTISRTTTVSFVVFQGVQQGENPLLTTMWTGLGDPKFTIAVPCWVGMKQVSEDLRGEKEGGAVGVAARKLRNVYYRERSLTEAGSSATAATSPAGNEESEREETAGNNSGSGQVATAVSGIETTGLQEVWKDIWAQEDEVITRVEKQLAVWRKKGVDPSSQLAIHLSSAEQGVAALKSAVKEAEGLFPPAQPTPASTTSTPADTKPALSGAANQ